eukprot:TRINITY_DN1373_c0_g1_i1.p1 TRINITY_DN1373_c0_g1~~TRINITY_DN1373_c0_g1_i1.p1  ORF type:complete len:310 (-),score=87.69 TRINITY_DN1373_c0_g1_i1:86-940(-)
MTEQLVWKVKELQKWDPMAKEQWGLYCQAMGGNIRDPARHEWNFLQDFIKNYTAGLRFEPNSKGGGSDAGNTADLIKEGQRKSNGWKEAWGAYVETYARNGKRDPAAHDSAFLTGFYDFLGQTAVMSLGGPAYLSAMEEKSSAKRKRVDTPTGDAELDAAIDRVKAFQRSGDEQKQMWWNYADTALGGVRDPKRHSAQVLNEFIASHGVPPTEALPAKIQRVGGGGGGSGNEALVDRIKAFQRSSPEGKDAWWNYSDNVLGGIRDPKRHSAEVLQEFIDSHGVP